MYRVGILAIVGLSCWLMACSVGAQSKPTLMELERDCESAADALAKTSGWAQGMRTGDAELLGWQHHYSEKHGGCYVQALYQNHSQLSATGPSSYSELYDAASKKQLGTCTDLLDTANFCTLRERDIHFDCKACKSFVEDHMNN